MVAIRHALTALAAAFALISNSQALAQDATPLEDLDFVVDLLRQDYAGFENKTADDAAAFEAQVDLARARIEERPDALIHAVSALLDTMRDNHLVVRSFMVSPADPWPSTSPESGPSRDFPNLSQTFAIRRLSDQTMYIRAPHFGADAAEELHGLLERHHDEIVSTPNLLIDLRDNGGGRDFVYAPLMAYLYTRPIYGIGVEFRASSRNMAMLEKIASDPETPQGTLDFLAGFMDRARAAEPGSWVSLWDRDFTIRTYPQVHDLPRRVGILAEGAASSGEQFVIDSRFSRKVTLMGGPTNGVIDYSNVVSAKAPSGKFEIRYPLTRSMRLPEEPFDNIGVQPDIHFGDDVADQVAAAQAWLERQVD